MALLMALAASPGLADDRAPGALAVPGAPSASVAASPVPASPVAASDAAPRTAFELPPVQCQCVHAGARFEIGETVCMRGRIATCGMVQNNTSWSISEMSCPVS